MNSEIKQLKTKLKDKLKKGSFLDEEVQKISQKLDKKIIDYYERKQAEKKIRKHDKKK